MASIDRLLHITGESVPHKISTKRSYATHRLDIEERMRRTIIGGKLKKLQGLVPNMDKDFCLEQRKIVVNWKWKMKKQTSYADMLEIAVQHIQTLRD
ncbi:transcription factor like [Capsicum galapagoense]